jgi:Ca2+-binding EF-hand superfamily protein
MVMQDEVIAYVEQESASSQSRVVMTVSHDGRSVFELLDMNPDRRITRRELQLAVERLKKFDRDGNGQITSPELVGNYSVVLELGKPAVFRENVDRSANQTAPLVTPPSRGPEWFRKMDRNRDGDVSRREFLGSPATFKRLDADGDGLISAEEADAATPL